MMQTQEGIDLFDDRSFSLIDYRHGHSFVVLRGFPEFDDEGADGVVLDFYFAGVQRVSCWTDVGPVHIRVADTAERAFLEERIGSIRENVFLLEPGSLESYVIAGRAIWAEFRIPPPFNVGSPLDPGNEQAVRDYFPLGGVVRSTR